MSKGLKLGLLAVAAAALVVSPLSAQVLTVPAGNDVWNTPANAGSVAVLSGAELNVLSGCNGNSTTEIPVKGKNLASGSNTDTKVRRAEDASFRKYGETVEVGIYVSEMTLESIDPVPTACGSLDLTFTAIPSTDDNPTSKMAITLEDSGEGGTFDADIVVPVLVTSAQNGRSVGTTFTLPSPGPMPWSTTAPSGAVNPNGNFHPGAHPGGVRGGIFCRGKWVPNAAHCYALAKKTCKGPSPIVGGRSVDSDITPVCEEEIEPIEVEPVGVAGN